MTFKRLFAAWCLFALYSAGAAAFVQFVALPLLLPQLHAGHGLLVNTDSVGYHEIAARLAAAISRQGWSAWVLAPDGHTAAGLATPFYALLAHEPWSLIPINAALHALSGIVVIRLTQLLTHDMRIAFVTGTLWVAYPSTLQWVTQIQKDGYFFAGVLSAILGWTLLARVIRERSSFCSVLAAAAPLFAGIASAGLVRPYVFQLLLPPALAIALIGTVATLMRSNTEWKLTPRIAVIGILLIVPVLLAGAPRDNRIEPVAAPHPTSAGTAADGQWQHVTWLPTTIDRPFEQVAIARRAYRSESYRAAGSMLDLEVQFRDASEVLGYLPRALQIGMLAPFPDQWSSSGASPGGTVMRRVATTEMMLLYPLLVAGLPLAAWRWWRRPEFWAPALISLYIILVYTCVTPNLGTLYRLRYGFLMTLAALGLAAIWQTLRERAAQRRPA